MVIPMKMILLHINSELVSYCNWCKRGWCNGCWSTKAWPLFFFSSCEIFLGRDQKRVKPIVCSGLGAVDWRRWAVWFFGTLFCDILGHFFGTLFAGILFVTFVCTFWWHSNQCLLFAVDLGRLTEEDGLRGWEGGRRRSCWRKGRWTNNLRCFMIYTFGGEPTICDILQFTIRRRTNIYEGKGKVSSRWSRLGPGENPQKCF